MIAANRPVALRIQWQLVDKGKDIVDTAAGKVISQELSEQLGRQQTELRRIREEMVEASKEGDEETVEELEEDGRKLEERVEKIKNDLEGMVVNYATEKERMEARVKEMEQKAKRERERTEAEGKRQLADRTRRLQDETNGSVADRPRLEQEGENPQDLVDIPAKTPADGPAHHDTPPHTRETELAENLVPPTPPRLPPQVTSLRVSCVRPLSTWSLTVTNIFGL